MFRLFEIISAFFEAMYILRKIVIGIVILVIVTAVILLTVMAIV